MLDTSRNQPEEQPVQKADPKKALRKKWGRRSLVVAAAAVCALVGISGMTYSYFSAKDQVVNELKTSDLDFEIQEPSWQEPDTPVRPGDVLPKDPLIVNTGQTDFVVRVKIEEVWTRKADAAESAEAPQSMIDPGYVRFFAANSGGEGADGAFPAQQLLNILQADQQIQEESKNFALRLNLMPNLQNPNTAYWNPENPNGWYRGKGVDGQPSEWLYYNRILQPAQQTDPVFRAVTIRRGQDLYSLEDIIPAEGEDAQTAYEKKLAEYNALLAEYDLDIYIYAETVQAEPFAWKDAWKSDLPAGWDVQWGGSGT